MEDLEQLVHQGQFREALEYSRGSTDPQVVLLHVKAALELGEAGYARDLLEGFPPFTNPSLESQRLVWLSWAYLALGDADGHFRLAQQAVQIYRSFDTLFSLAHSLLPQQAFLVLKEVLTYARNAREESEAAVALARILELLGRFREGYAYASLAYLRTPHDPAVAVAYATLALADNDRVVLEDLLGIVGPIAQGGEYVHRLQFLNLLADIYLLLGQPQKALEMVEQNLELVSKDHLPLICLPAMRTYLLLGKQERMLMLLQAAQLSSSTYPFVQAYLQLALGLASYPGPGAQEAFEEAIKSLGDSFLPATLIARLYLLDLRGDKPGDDLLGQLEQWSRHLLSLYPPLLQASRRGGYRLRVLGTSQLSGPEGVVPLAPRAVELLVLMLSRPQGWERAALSEALYGTDRPRAFKSEIYRLKKVLGEGIQPRPWRVTLEVTADFLELRQCLKRGEVEAALRVYQGSLLPQSDAPGIEELRHEIEEDLRQAALASSNLDLIFALSDQLADDLELLERPLEVLPAGDWRGLVVLSRIRRLRKSYER